MQNMSQIDLKGKRVLMRLDCNVPISEDGAVRSDQRIVAALPTIKHALDSGAQVLLMSHLGRPAPGEDNQAYSLLPVAKCLSKHLGMTVPLIEHWINGVDMNGAHCALLENVRFLEGEMYST